MAIEYMRTEPGEVEVGGSFTFVMGIINDTISKVRCNWKAVITGKEKKTGATIWEAFPSGISSLDPNGTYEYRKSDINYTEEESTRTVEISATVTLTNAETRAVEKDEWASIKVKEKTKSPIEMIIELIGGLLPMSSNIGPPLPRILNITWIPKYPYR